MAGKRRQFTLEFKLEAVQLASTSKKPLAQVARELGIRPEMLRTWRRQAESRAGLAPGDVFPGNGKLSSQEHNPVTVSSAAGGDTFGLRLTFCTHPAGSPTITVIVRRPGNPNG